MKLKTTTKKPQKNRKNIPTNAGRVWQYIPWYITHTYARADC